ncbi:DUF397 domain-containing protein [Streptomyces coeruleorubidus]|uniref:DUF397 domain-containing protein n=1 Tax=Streptomyces coeruleorubidus TaxID=116188 RepID=A0A5J6I5V2_STRC4|nr:DUF397 domain-containing protein [Streptomyces coeruleorubidus]QEV26040.1 DUF397 domain-containing protein [Streptomyces coeruleorubidus]GGT77512.1 DUF397 domain-containing protein [Streptomyces coeruleorubidus]
MTPTPLTWIKSSYSGNDGPDCVEVAISLTRHPTIHIRDSKNKDAARLEFTDGAWSDFLEFAVGR